MTVFSDNDALERFETIWEHVECGISIVDAETREILDINPVAARMFGDAKEKIIGKRCHKFICPAEACSCPIMDKNQVVDRSERVFVTASGKTLPIIKSVAKIRYKGRLALLESFTDISKLKEAEEKLRFMRVTEQANQAKSDFLSRMSHEMRTPMNAIIGMTKIAESTDDVARLKYCLATIGASSTHLLGIINDVLDMSKIEAGKLDLDTAPLNLENMLAKLCGFIAGQAESKGVALGVNLDLSMPMDYAGDEQRLSQVLANLLSNAVKFTPEGGRVRLAVEEVKRSESAALLRFTVSDTGIGMTGEQIGRLFNAFEQADTSISRRFGGTGLGLAISRGIVEKMNGNIRAESQPGQGSVFTVEVELAPRPEVKRPAPRFGCRTPEDIRLLAVSGDEDTRGHFLAIARHAGLSAQGSASAPEAVSLVAEALRDGRPYDAVFLDQALAGEELHAAGELAGAGAGNIILMASFIRWSAIGHQAARRAGMERFVAMPLFPSAVLGVLSESLERKEPSGGEGEACGEPDFSGLCILLVEDVPINREIFQALLESTGIRMDTAENGLEAVKMFRNDPKKYDAIIMDVQMPVMDGYSATAAIRGLDAPRAGEVPIIAMTANAFKEDADRCLSCGMSDHLAKPIDEKAVKEKIAFFCRKR